MHFEVDRQTEADFLEHLRREIAAVLHDVQTTVSDWQAMRERMTAVIDELTTAGTRLECDELEEIQAFLEWAREDHFTFLGYRCYDLKKGKRLPALHSVGGTGLGILREDAASGHESRAFKALPDDVKQEARTGSVLTLTKTNRRATVHRPSYMDYIGVRRLNAKGEVIGEHRFLGLYTSAAYNRNPRSIPILRRKIDQVLKRAHLPPTSHAHKALVNVLETYPRDELFQISAEELHDIAIGVLHLQERQRVRLFVRRDPFRRFVSCLVFTPRDRYNTDVRQRMQHILEDTFHGDQSEFSIRLSESVLARIHFIVRIPDHVIPDFDPDALQRRIAETVRSWKDDLADALLDYYGEERSNRLYQRYGESFNAAYREDTSPRAAAHDIERLEHLNPDQTLAIVLYQPLEATEGLLRLRLFHYGRPVSLSDALPVLENMGVRVIDERPYEVHAHQDRPACFIHDFGLQYNERQDFEFERSTQDLRGVLRRRLAPPRGRRRLQRPGARRPAGLAGNRHPARLQPLPAPGRHHLQPELHAGDLRRQPTHRPPAGPPLPHPLRSPARGRQAGLAAGRADRTGVQRRPQPGPGPHPAPHLVRHSGHGPHQLLPEHRHPARQGLRFLQTRTLPDSRNAPTPAALRDLRLFSAYRRRAPARRARGPGRHPLVRPARRLPHGSAGADEGADGEERRHRSGGRQGRLRGQESARRSATPCRTKFGPVTASSSAGCWISPTT